MSGRAEIFWWSLVLVVAFLIGFVAGVIAGEGRVHKLNGVRSGHHSGRSIAGPAVVLRSRAEGRQALVSRSRLRQEAGRLPVSAARRRDAGEIVRAVNSWSGGSDVRPTKLYTHLGGFLATVLVPDFVVQPEGIQWSNRFFFWDQKRDQYREGMLYEVTDCCPQMAAKITPTEKNHMTMPQMSNAGLPVSSLPVVKAYQHEGDQSDRWLAHGPSLLQVRHCGPRRPGSRAEKA